MEETDIAEFDLEDLYVVYSPFVLGDVGILTVIPKNELYVEFNTYQYVLIFFIALGYYIYPLIFWNTTLFF